MEQYAATALPQHREIKEVRTCKNGFSCRFLRENRCMFYHPEAAQPPQSEFEEVQQEGEWMQVKPRRPNQKLVRRGAQSGDSSDGVMWCNAGHKCDKGRVCKFRHKETQTVRRISAKDFSKRRSERRK